MPKKQKEKKLTYQAFYSDGTVKVGYCGDVLKRMRSLGGSSSCLVAFRSTHKNENEARDSETKLKKILREYVIVDAECREWFVPERGFFPTLKKALEDTTIEKFEVALALGQKKNVDWQGCSPSEVKKIVNKRI
tara:strand:+ start:65 stop:466 length:402 start_codon:yes stop_codon:yes gene_type:complete